MYHPDDKPHDPPPEPYREPYHPPTYDPTDPDISSTWRGCLAVVIYMFAAAAIWQFITNSPSPTP